MKKLIPLLVVTSIVLTSCGAPVVTDTPEPKKIPFTIETRELDSFPKSYTLEKSGRLVGSSSISLTSQWVGRVDKVLVKEGATVKKGQALVLLRDTIANYDIRLGQAKNALGTVRNSAASNELSLDRTISDSRLALERANSDLKTAESTAELNIIKALRDVQKAQIVWPDSDATITLLGLEASLAKSKLDYQNLISSNEQTLINFGNSFSTSVNDLKKFTNKIVFDGDKLYWITPAYQADNTIIRRGLASGNSYAKPLLEFAFFDVAAAEKEVALLSTTPPAEWDLLVSLDRLSKYYKTSRKYFDATTTYLQTATSNSDLTQIQLDALIATNNGYKAELSGLENGWVAFRNQAATFLANYRNNQAAAQAGLVVQERNNESAKRGLTTWEFESSSSLDRIRATTQQSITTARIARDSAKIAYDNALKSKNLALGKIALSESDAGLSLAQAREEFDKLTIRAPIDGSVTKVLANVGQDVNAGTLMIEMANKTPELSIDVEAAVVPLLAIGSVQNILYDGTQLKATVVGVSQIATESLLYTARLVLAETPSLLGQVARVQLILPSKYPVMSTDIVQIVSDKKGQIVTLSGSILTPVEVDLGRIAASRIEVITNIDTKTMVVTTNTSNFDAKKSELIIKK